MSMCPRFMVTRHRLNDPPETYLSRVYFPDLPSAVSCFEQWVANRIEDGTRDHHEPWKITLTDNLEEWETAVPPKL
jgi:hypothetical protein